MLRKLLLIIFFTIMFNFNSFGETNELIINNSKNFFLDDEIINIFLDFQEKYNITPYLHIIEEVKQTELERIIEDYKLKNSENNYLVFFVSLKNNKPENIAIFNSGELINDTDKILMLTSMESSIKNNNLKEAINIALHNISKILTIKSSSNVSFSQINIEDTNNSAKRLLLYMGLSFFIFISSFYFLIHKKNKP